MKLTNILFPLFFVSLQITAQTKFGLGYFVSPEISITSVNRPKNSATTGIILSYDISKKVGVASGIWYSNKGYKETGLTLYSDNGTIHNNGKAVTSFNYLEFPLLLNFKLKTDSKIGFMSSIGSVLGIVMNEKWKYVPDIGHNQTISGSYLNSNSGARMSPLLSINISAGIFIRMNEYIVLTVEPNYKRSLNKIYKTDESLKYFSSYGVRFGALFKFHN